MPGEALQETVVLKDLLNRLDVLAGHGLHRARHGRAVEDAHEVHSGLEGADAVNLYIPFTVKAVDGFSGKPKTYTEPQAFFASSDRTGLWTLSTTGNGGDTFFVKGEFVTDNEGVALAHDNCWNVTKVDAKDFGSADMQHWEVGGK